MWQEGGEKGGESYFYVGEDHELARLEETGSTEKAAGLGMKEGGRDKGGGCGVLVKLEGAWC